ncbi:hypothetical protein Tco_0559765 [Tanacetum coccineum]
MLNRCGRSRQLDAMLPQIRERFAKNTALVAWGYSLHRHIHTWLERFNKQKKPHSFEKAVAPVMANGENAWVLLLSWAAFKEAVLSLVFPSSRARAFEEGSTFPSAIRASEKLFTDVDSGCGCLPQLGIPSDRDDYDRSDVQTRAQEWRPLVTLTVSRG